MKFIVYSLEIVSILYNGSQICMLYLVTVSLYLVVCIFISIVASTVTEVTTSEACTLSAVLFDRDKQIALLGSL